MGLGAESPLLQELQGVPLTLEEVSTRLESLHRIHDQVKIVELGAGRLKEVSRKTSHGVVENGRELCQCNRCRLIEGSGRAAAQDYLLDRVFRLFFFQYPRQVNCLACRSRRWKDLRPLAPLNYFLRGSKRGRVVPLKHGGILNFAL